MSLHTFVSRNPPNFNEVYFGNAAPAAPDGNQYATGDFIQYTQVPSSTTPAPGSPFGWLCVLGGPGGTAQWVELGAGQAVSPASLAGVANTISVTTADSGALIKVTIPFNAIPAGASPVQVGLFTPPTKSIVYGSLIKHSVAFSGGGVTGMTVSIGTAGSAALYGAAFNVFQVVANNTFETTDIFTIDNWVVPGAIVATFTSTGAAPSAATAGSVDIYIWVKVARF